jgi:hypothetical protein
MGFNMDAYAKQKHGPSARAILVSPDAFGWRILYENQQQGFLITNIENVDMNDVAVTQLGHGHTAAFSNFNDPFSWHG